MCVTQRSKSHEDPESRVSSGPGAVLCVCVMCTADSECAVYVEKTAIHSARSYH